MLDLNVAVKLNKNIVLRGLADKYWALDVTTGSQYKLNEVSYTLLNLCREPKTTAQIVDLMLQEYNVSQERLMADCCSVLQPAVEKGIVKEV